MSLSLHIFPSVLLSDLKALRSRSKVIQKRKGTMSSACSGQQLSGLTKENFMNATMNKMKDAGILSVSTSIHIFMHTHICFFSCSVSCSKGCISVAVAWIMSFRYRTDLICYSRWPCCQVAYYWSSVSGLHIAGLHLASQEAIRVFAVAVPNIPSTWTVPRQVFSEEMTGSGPMLFTPKWAFIECEGSCVTTSEAHIRVNGAVQEGILLPPKDTNLALTLCFGALNICCL